MMRPKSLEWFDRIFYLSTAITVGTGFINLSALRDQMVEQSAMDSDVLLWAGLSLLATVGVTLANWYFVSRRGNKIAIALWVVINLFSVLTVPKLIKAISVSDTPFIIVLPALLGDFLACASVVMLFQRDAQIWFKTQQGKKDTQ
jgi:hypothetical protein